MARIAVFAEGTVEAPADTVYRYIADLREHAVTTFTVSSHGAASLVQISSTWDGAGGIGGVFERIFAPRVLRAIYADELKRLDAYAREHPST